ncbi:MAG: hypothetical protein AABY16_00360 [Nanoarchaeota archaeon]
MNYNVHLIALLLILPLVSAANLQVEQVEKNGIILTEYNNNATFKLQITNNEERSDEFQIYSLVSVTIYPKELFIIEEGSTITLDITAIPSREILKDRRGIYAFEYQIKGKNTGYFKDNLAIKILEAKDAVDVAVDNIELNANSANLRIKNKEKIKINDLKLVIKSRFFEFAQTLSLDSEEEKNFSVPILLDSQVEAGEYVVESLYELNGKKSSETATLSYLEEGSISVTEDTVGFIIKKTTITKKNEGNIPTAARITARKNILTRLFTVYSDRPATSERIGIFVDYSWEKELGVGESYTVTVTTNYTLPFVMILLVIAVALLTRFLVTSKVVVKKRVVFVRTKGGEFALKVTLRIKSNKNVSHITLTDRIPGHAKLYNKFGIPPHRIEESTRKIEWDITHLNAGEERVFTYVIYSKINIVGSFELPSASASFEHDGKKEHVFSNKTYFASETTEN